MVNGGQLTVFIMKDPRNSKKFLSFKILEGKNLQQMYDLLSGKRSFDQLDASFMGDAAIGNIGVAYKSIEHYKKAGAILHVSGIDGYNEDGSRA